jgi:hypothetical protein
MSMPSMSFTFMALSAFGDLPSAGARRDRIGPSDAVSDAGPGNGAVTSRTREEVP